MAIKISKNRMDLGGTPVQNVSSQDFDQIATPSAPPASHTRVYSKTDGKVYRYPAGGAETEVGKTTTTRYLWLDAGSAILRPSGTTAAERVLVDSDTNQYWYELRYDDTTNQRATWGLALPDGWDGGSISCEIFWKAAATSGNVYWRVYYQAIGDDDIWDVNVTQLGSNTTDTAKGTSEDLNTVTVSGTPTASTGDSFRLQVFRYAGDPADTMSGDAKVLGVKVAITVTL